jgi:hypothetical protein
MFPTFRILFIATALATSAFAQTSIPTIVMVGTEEMQAKDFSSWTETDATKYDGTYSGDVGGDSSGKLTFKAGKAKKDESMVYASGSYSLTPAGATPTLVKFENAVTYGDPVGVFSAGAFNIVFVKFGKKKGAIIGSTFIPRE